MSGRTPPTAIAVDVGMIDGRWAVVEANAAWAGGTYTADPQRALDVILRASGPADAVTDRNRPCLRAPARPLPQCTAP